MDGGLAPCSSHTGLFLLGIQLALVLLGFLGYIFLTPIGFVAFGSWGPGSGGYGSLSQHKVAQFESDGGTACERFPENVGKGRLVFGWASDKVQ